jgi:hypothetical protein
MTLDTLKHLRKITPVMIGITYLFLVGYLTSTWSFELPKWSDLETGSVAFLFLAWFAYVFSFRDKINKTHHNKILSNIRLQIVDIGGKTDDPSVYTWGILKPVFFKLIDNDKSLSVLASSAYDNGYYWATCADITAIGLVFLSFTVFLIFLGVSGGWLSFFTFLIISFLGHIGSKRTTDIQMRIGNEQLEVMRRFYTDDITRYIDALGT